LIYLNNEKPKAFIALAVMLGFVKAAALMTSTAQCGVSAVPQHFVDEVLLDLG